MLTLVDDAWHATALVLYSQRVYRFVSSPDSYARAVLVHFECPPRDRVSAWRSYVATNVATYADRGPAVLGIFPAFSLHFGYSDSVLND